MRKMERQRLRRDQEEENKVVFFFVGGGYLESYRGVGAGCSGYARAHESGSVQLQGRAEAGTDGAFPGCARTRAYRSQTSPPVSKRT